MTSDELRELRLSSLLLLFQGGDKVVEQRLLADPAAPEAVAEEVGQWISDQ